MLKVFAVETGREDRHNVARRMLKLKYEEIWQKPMPRIVSGEHGKLSFCDDEAHFCFSYTDGLAFCAISDGVVGLDVESIRSVSANAISRILSRDEWLCYSRSEDPAETFVRFWTLKEAYCKFTGQGISGISFKDTVFDLSGDRPILVDRPELRFWSRCIGGVAIALCADFPHRPELYSLDVI